MNTYDVKCPVCGVVNHSLFLEETDGWMECEHCGHTAKYCWEPQTKKQIPVFVIRNLQAQVVPADCVHTCSRRELNKCHMKTLDGARKRYTAPTASS